MASEYMESVEKLFGPAGMKRHPTRREMYEAMDFIKTTLLKQQDRLEAIEGKNGKARVRVPAGRQQA